MLQPGMGCCPSFTLSPDTARTIITPQGLYCYNVMLFWLENAVATYQRLMTHIFKPLISRTVEVYIDDIIIKNKTHLEHLLHFEEALCLIHKYDMKLNPIKCVFRVSVGRFLIFMVTQRVFDLNPS